MSFVSSSVVSLAEIALKDLTDRVVYLRPVDQRDDVLPGEVVLRVRIRVRTAVGHSFGADVVLAMAYDCSRLPPIAFLPVLPTLATLTHRLTPPWMARLTSRVGFAPEHQDAHGSDDWSDDPQRVALDRAVMKPRMYRTVLADQRARLAALPLDVQARDLGLPVLAILGGRDRLYPSPPTAARYRAAGAQVVVIDDAGGR